MLNIRRCLLKKRQEQLKKEQQEAEKNKNISAGLKKESYSIFKKEQQIPEFDFNPEGEYIQTEEGIKIATIYRDKSELNK